MLAEAREHPDYRVIKNCPGFGKIRTAQLMPVVVTTYRSANRRQFKKTRGLNRHFKHTLKQIFKGAATTVIGLDLVEDAVPRRSTTRRYGDHSSKPIFLISSV